MQARRSTSNPNLLKVECLTNSRVSCVDDVCSVLLCM